MPSTTNLPIWWMTSTSQIFSILQAAKAKKGYNAVNNAITKQPSKESQKDKKASLPSTDLELTSQPPDASLRREGQSVACLAERLLVRLPAVWTVRVKHFSRTPFGLEDRSEGRNLSKDCPSQ